MNLFYRGKGLRALPRFVMAAAIALPLASCNTDELVAVTDPERLRPEDLSGPEAVPALVSGAIRQFNGGYSGFGDDSFLSSSAVITDEWYYGDTFPTRQAADQRTMRPAVLGNISDAAYVRLHQARLNARRAFAVVQQFTSAATAGEDAATQSLLRAIEGYTYVTLSEGWCGNVPFSTIPDTGPLDPGAIEFGPGLSTNAMNEAAVVRFAEARTLFATNRIAQVGQGRALLNLGRYQDAAAAVATVPTTFVFFAEHSPSTGAENNPVFALQSNGRYGIANLEGADPPTGVNRPDAPTSGTGAPPLTAPGAEGLPFRGYQDPRIPHQSRPNCFTASVRCWMNNNYPDLEADVPVASGIEARLIEAEAAYQRGDFVTMMAKLNELRANASARLTQLYPRARQTFPAIGTPTLEPLADPGTAEGRRSLIFQERALWLFNTGHRQGDLRRLVRNYGLASSSVWPTGSHFRGGTFGSDVSYPVPFNEQNNPQYKPEACVTSQN